MGMGSVSQLASLGALYGTDNQAPGSLHLFEENYVIFPGTIKLSMF